MWLALAIIVGAVVLAELGARWAGLGRPLLYETTDYGYRVVPGQSLKRFGNRVAYNSFGMRSEETAAHPAPGVLRVLCVGDSITFGSTSTDQPLTYPYQLQARLEHEGGAGRYEVLNISAGGWAMENEEGWLAANGIYGSQAVVLQVATHDLFQEKAGPEVVGTHAAFPERPPRLALQELMVRYVLPRISHRLKLRDPGEVLYHHDRNDVARTMATLERVARLVRREGAELFVLFVEQPRGREPDDELTRYGKTRLYAKTEELGIPLILTGAAMEAAGGAQAFIDGLHPNVVGNRVMAEQTARRIIEWQRSGKAETRPRLALVHAAR